MRVYPKDRYYNMRLEEHGQKEAKADRGRTAKKIISLRSNTKRARRKRAQWAKDPSKLDLAGIDTKPGGRRFAPEFELTRKDLEKRFGRRSSKRKRADRMRTAKPQSRTMVKHRTEHALETRREFLRDPSTVDISGIDTKRTYKKRSRRNARRF